MPYSVVHYYSIKSFCTELLEKQIVTIRETAKVIGKLVASFPEVTYGGGGYQDIFSLWRHQHHFKAPSTIDN